MTKAGAIAVPLSRHHCRATVWWLVQRFAPFALAQWRLTGRVSDAFALATAMRHARDFEGFAKRRLHGDNQDRDANRTMPRGDAAWLAGMVQGGHSEGFPELVLWTGVLPTSEQLATMPLPAAQAILFGLGANETMRRCHDRVYVRKKGPQRKSLTLESVATRNVGNPSEGGDERYERRLRKRAREDETAAAIALELDHAMRALESRSKDRRENFP